MQEQALDSALHFPHELSHVMYLKCSCGYSGLVSVNEEVHSGEEVDEVDEVAECPNCKSKTVHPKHVTEKPTTIHRYENGKEEKLVAKEVEESKPISVAPVSTDEVVKAVMQHPMFTRLSAFLDEQSKPKMAESKPASTPVTTPTEGATSNG